MSDKKIQRMFKRLFDFLSSLVVLIILMPLLVLIAIIIRLDSPGPAFFRQERLGRGGKVFRVVKFRTMFVGAANGMVEDSRRDPRITRAGYFLRKWSLDELPQLWNVLVGEMSLVGPRPDRVFRLTEYDELKRVRLNVRPGITGWAQVNGRNSIPWEERYKLDAEYVKDWSLWFDTRILFKTIGVVFFHRDVDAGTG